MDIEKVDFYKFIIFIDEYMKVVKFGNYKNYGWFDFLSVMVKIFLMVLVWVLIRELVGDVWWNILINVCCLGWMIL